MPPSEVSTYRPFFENTHPLAESAKSISEYDAPTGTGSGEAFHTPV
jgi:hypothetical protein